MGATDKSFVIKNLILRSGRFGKPRKMVPPKGGILGSTHFNKSTAIYAIGTVIEIWNSQTAVPGSAATSGSGGWSEFVYGQFAKDDGPTLLGSQVCMPEVLTQLFDFTNDKNNIGSEAVQNYSVVALDAMTDDYYGWFWSGGVCPADHIVPWAAGTIACVSAAIVAGSSVQAAVLSADAIGLAICDGAQDPIGTALIASS